MAKFSGGRVLNDVFIMPPRPYICPDCHTMHKGECPVRVQEKLAAKLFLVDELADALADHASHINQIIQGLQSVVNGLEEQERAIIQLHERVSALERLRSKRKGRRAPVQSRQVRG